MKMQKNPLSRKNDIVVQELGSETLIYDLKDNQAFCLNETSALVWHMCDGKNSISDMSAELSRILKTPVEDDFVWLALDQLKQKDLIDGEIAAPSAFEGVNRRDVIKRIGLASMIALPIVAGIIAPNAAQAASTCPNPNNITATNQSCASFNCTTFCAAVYGPGTTSNGCTQTGNDVSCACCT